MTSRRRAPWILASLAVAIALPAAARSQRTSAEPKLKVMYNLFRPPVMSVFIADANGANEHPLFSSPGFDYSPSYSADGKWIVVTRERSGQADIFRVHPDGSGLEQLTDDPAFAA